MSAKSYDIIIIGAGMAGMTAAIYACRANKTVLVLENKVPGGQIVGTFRVENWPGDFGVSGADLSEKICEQMKKLGAELVYTNVEKVEKEEDRFLVESEDGAFQASAVILAMGCKDRELDVPGGHELSGKGIFYCATCDGSLYKDQDVAVVGGGNSALSGALYLSDIVRKISIINLGKEFKGDAVIVDKLKAKGNVEFLMGYETEEVLGEDKVRGIRLKPSGMMEEVKDDLELSVGGVFVAIGKQPATDCAALLVKLDDAGYVMAGDDCHTSRDGVFVAGDCRTKTLRQLVTAAADGAMAAGEAVKFLR